MKLADMDLVYPLNSRPSSCEDLRYSLRSACENLPHRSVVVIGMFLPTWMETSAVVHIPCPDDYHRHKIENTGVKLQAICDAQEISDPFILMNDDFFALNPIEDIPYYAYGSIYEHLSLLLKRHSEVSDYMRFMAEAGAFLADEGCPTMDFGIHAPMIVHKAMMKRVLGLGKRALYRRTIYGNMGLVNPVEIVEDFKYWDLNTPVDMDRPFASTSNAAFNTGQAGIDIRKRFPNPCKYERKPL